MLKRIDSVSTGCGWFPSYTCHFFMIAATVSGKFRFIKTTQEESKKITLIPTHKHYGK